jgi:glycosyltransferase involved in cell wall biosynthesis
VFYEQYGVLEVDPLYLKDYCKLFVEKSAKPEKPEENLSPKLGIKARVKGKLKKILKKLIPSKTRQWLRKNWFGEGPLGRYWFIPHKLRKGLKYAWFGPDSLRPKPIKQERRSRKLLAPEITVGKNFYPITLMADDVVIDLGAIWAVEGLMETIEKYKRQIGFRLVTMIYDLIPIRNPQFFEEIAVENFTAATEWQLRNSDLIFAISNYVKSDISKYALEIKINVCPVETILLGSDLAKRTNKITESKQLDSSNLMSNELAPYVLTVGTIEVRKNHFGMYLAWKRLRKLLHEKTPHLVIAGKPGWLAGGIIHHMQHDPETRDLIKVMTEVSDDKLTELYENCLFTLYPSFEEGWGLPVEESMVYGKLCITSNRSSMPEVGKEYADYVEPDDINSIVNAIIKALEPDYRKNRENLIQEKFKPNTWESCVKGIDEILIKHFGKGENKSIADKKGGY